MYMAVRIHNLKLNYTRDISYILKDFRKAVKFKKVSGNDVDSRGKFS